MASSVVQLLRAQDKVFYDIDSIPAGERWRDALLLAIDNASHFYLLWCMHSADSEEVEWEWQRAISGNKRLVPVLLDSTPLVKPLTEYQWVDFQGVVQGHKPPQPIPPMEVEPPSLPPPAPPSPMPPPPPPRAQSRALLRLALFGLAVLAVVALVFTTFSSDTTARPSIWPTVFVVLTVVVVLALVAPLARRYQRSRRTRRTAEQRAAEKRFEEERAIEQRAIEQRAIEQLAEAIAQDLAFHRGRG